MQNERQFEASGTVRTFTLSVPEPLENKKEVLPPHEKTSLFVPTRYLTELKVGFLPSSFSPQVFVTRNIEELINTISKHGDTAKRDGEDGLEMDPTRQQIIIYTMVICQEHLLWYRRAAKNESRDGVLVHGEPRLQGRYSVGFGGHKTKEDIVLSREELSFLRPGLGAIHDEVGTRLGLNRGLFTEVQEEISVGRDGIKNLQLLGGFVDKRIEDPSLKVQVGEVHMGIAAAMEVDPQVVSTLTLRESEIAEAWWVPLDKAKAELEKRQKDWEAKMGPKVEGWSEILIKEFWKDLRHKV
ncbi:hypothetical protein HY502_03370 [Candidatus Woesebacteria bacterium]|nr:hypothetical protein [Candidatus Woesebacteria bacterium]